MAFWYFFYPNVATPNGPVSEGIPKMNELIIAGRQKLILLRVSS